MFTKDNYYWDVNKYTNFCCFVEWDQRKRFNSNIKPIPIQFVKDVNEHVSFYIFILSVKVLEVDVPRTFHYNLKLHK